MLGPGGAARNEILDTSSSLDSSSAAGAASGNVFNGKGNSSNSNSNSNSSNSNGAVPPPPLLPIEEAHGVNVMDGYKMLLTNTTLQLYSTHLTLLITHHHGNATATATAPHTPTPTVLSFALPIKPLPITQQTSSSFSIIEQMAVDADKKTSAAAALHGFSIRVKPREWSFSNTVAPGMIRLVADMKTIDAAETARMLKRIENALSSQSLNLKKTTSNNSNTNSQAQNKPHSTNSAKRTEHSSTATSTTTTSSSDHRVLKPLPPPSPVRPATIAVTAASVVGVKRAAQMKNRPGQALTAGGVGSLAAMGGYFPKNDLKMHHQGIFSKKRSKMNDYHSSSLEQSNTDNNSSNNNNSNNINNEDDQENRYRKSLNPPPLGSRIIPTTKQQYSYSGGDFNYDEDDGLLVVNDAVPAGQFYGGKSSSSSSIWNIPDNSAVPHRPQYQTSTSSSSGYYSNSRFKDGFLSGEMYTGFQNLGQTCYIGSVLQMLANVGTFYKDVISYASFYPNICGREDLDKDPSSVLRETIALFQTRQRGKQRVLSPRYVKEAMGEVSVRFADSDQQDAQEFFAEFCERIDQECKIRKAASAADTDMDDVAPTAPAVSTTPSSLTTTTASSSSPATTTAQVEAAISSTDIVKENSGEKEEGDKDIKQDNLKEGAKPEESTSITTNTKESMITPVSKNFEWRVDHCVVCTQCDAKSSHEEVYRDLSVNFVATPREASLSGAAKCRVADLILDFFKDEKVSYTCAHCRSSDAVKQHAIRTLPRVLILHLKRFAHFYDAGTGRVAFMKRKDPVDVPHEVVFEFKDDTREWIICNENIDHDDDDDVYMKIKGGRLRKKFRLEAIVNHSGSSPARGHYVCDVYDNKLKQWRCHNDSIVSIESNNLPHLRQQTAYLLAYVLHQ